LSYATVALDAVDGSQLWVGRYGGQIGGDHYATGIAISPRGSVYVTGESESVNGWSDFATPKYANA
jgi:hypothetical protein